MSNKYHMVNDEVQLGDIVPSSILSQGKEAWDYFWKDPRYNDDWVTGTEGRLIFSSKDAAKRAISRMVKGYPPVWENTEFVVAKVCGS